jgi:hypothetical protein
MTLYRVDLQYGIPLYEAPDGFYWCTQVWYFEASSPGAYASGKEGAIRLCAEGLNVNTLLWSGTIRELPSLGLIESFVPIWDHPTLSGPFDPPTLTVYVSLLASGRQVSYKRVRSPVRHEDYNADLTLTDSALAYYQSVFDNVSLYPELCNNAGVHFDGAKVYPKVVSWGLRRGTRRRWERRPLY